MVSASRYMSSREILAENFDQQKMILHSQSFSPFLPGMSKRWREIALLFPLGINADFKEEKKKDKTDNQNIISQEEWKREGSKKHERLSNAEEKQNWSEITISADQCPLRKLRKCITISYSPLNSALFYDLNST